METAQEVMEAFPEAFVEPEAPLGNDYGSLAVESLKEALGSFLNRDQVRDLVLKELNKYYSIKTIELKTPEATKTLSDELRHKLFPDILQTINLNIPLALIGPAGSGKSTVVEQVTKSLGLKFYLQNGVSGSHELTGYNDAQGRYVSTAFRVAYETGGVIFVDEADTSEAGAFKWINTAIANGYASFPDKAELVMRHADFRIVIAANTYGTGADRLYVGANQLDASTLDRFVFIDFGYDEELETLLSANAGWASRVQQVRAAAFKEKARIVVSPRATINGAKLLEAGWSQETVETRVIWKGIDPDLKKRIIGAMVAEQAVLASQFGFGTRHTSKKYRKAH